MTTLTDEKSIRLLVLGRQLGPTGTGRAIRERSGLSVAEAAEALGVSAGHLSCWERNITRPRRDAASTWATFCCLLADLLGDRPPARAEDGDPDDVPS